MQPRNFNTTRAVISIKNMVGNSCMKLIEQEFRRTGFIEVIRIQLGEAEIQFDSQVMSLDSINLILKKNGFELLQDKEKILVEQVKTAIIQLIFYGNNATSLMRNSDYLSEKLGQPYLYLSKVFSEKTGTTLEKFTILIKVEKIKELISYNQLTLSEIAYMMGYSSVQYLSNQFKQVTGVTVSEYKTQKDKGRKPLSSL
ncbi:MAG: helix-turn-helix domain-containing protein [Bacteroidia bacterium]